MKLKWTTQQRKVSELIPYEDNPRRLTPEQEQKLKESLEKFDLVEIPAINTDNTILAGHQRIKVLSLLGKNDEIIDVRLPNRKLTEDEVKEYVIRSNRNTGEWDFDILLEHFELDDLMNWGFVPEDFDGVIQQDKEKDKKEDDVPVLDKTAPTVTKLGDLIELGNHRLMCGDATNKDHIKTLMGGGYSCSCVDRPSIQRELQRTREKYKNKDNERPHGTVEFQGVFISRIPGIPGSGDKDNAFLYLPQLKLAD